jgi:hypothetical protein
MKIAFLEGACDKSLEHKHFTVWGVWEQWGLVISRFLNLPEKPKKQPTTV